MNKPSFDIIKLDVVKSPCDIPFLCMIPTKLPIFLHTLTTLEFGKSVGIMHKNGISHGDLTTSNFIVSKENMFIIDFGLASRTLKSDDHAVDLRLFKEILNSAHADIFERAWSNFLSGYKSSVGKERFAKITNKVMIIESRGRYARVV